MLNGDQIEPVKDLLQVDVTSLPLGIETAGVEASAWAAVAREKIRSESGLPFTADDRDTVLSWLNAEDKLPFTTIANSETLRTLIEGSLGEQIPRLADSIKNIVLGKAEEIR